MKNYSIRKKDRGAICMKKIMFLGGATQQITAIKYAKEQGYYTILCDYLVDNPGQFYADEFHCVSTTDKNAVLEVAKKTNIDGIVAYATEAAAATAAYVGNALKLPSNSYESVLLLSKKNLFREFLKNNGFNYPKAKSFSTMAEAKDGLNGLQFPLMIKPVDSSASRGVSRIDSKEGLDYAFNNALSRSVEKLVIIEEYIEMAHECMIGGDIIVIDRNIEFLGLLNGYRDIKNNSFVPYGNSYPIFIEAEKLEIVRKELQKLMGILKIEMGVFNIEIMFDKNEKPYIIEIGPRNGGNLIAELLEVATGVDLVGVTVEAAINNNLDIEYTPADVYYSTYYLHSVEKGKINNIIFDDEIKNNVIDKVIYKEYGDEIEVFDGLDKVIGIVFLKYYSLEELKYKMSNMDKYIDIQMIS